jgi:Tfp pilus assembly protein PilF
MVSGAKGMIAHYGGPLSKLINGTAVLPNLKKAQVLQPNSAAVMFGLGSFYLLAPPLAGGNLGKAEEYLKKAITIDPFFADAYVRLGQFYKIKGDNQKYSFYLNKALEIDPQNELANDIYSGKCKFICD